MAPLYEALTTHGCTLSAGGVIPFRCGGRLKGGRFTLPGNVSSQFISGLLLALPLLYEDSVIEITGDIESKDYIAMTLSALRLFGINIEFRGNNLYVNGGIKYISPGIVTVEGDWSNAAFWLCAGAIGKHGVKCTGLDISSSQGDKAIYEILTQFGAQVTVSDNSVTVSGSELYGTELDVKDIPDLVPALAVVASAAKGKTIIKNASRLRIKESDRLYAVTNALSALGADIAETGDGLIVTGQKRLKGGRTDSFGDHRIAMMASIASVVCDNPVIIENAGSVKKSYPNTTNIRIVGNDVYNCGHDTSLTDKQQVFSIQLLGNKTGFPYCSNPIMHAYNESIIFENNCIMNTPFSYMLTVSFWENTFNVPNSIFKFKNNTTNIAPISGYYSLQGSASGIATKITDVN
jgi:3-phosphoshikimate 1-carboxyvinyltransferase